MWIGTDGGLSLLKPGANRFINYRRGNGNAQTLLNNSVNAIAVDGDRLWLGTSEGLCILNTRSGETSGYRQDPRNIHSITVKSVRCVYIDNQGIYWPGTIRGGVDKFDRNLNLFNFAHSNVFDDKGLNASIVTAFAEAENGDVYVGTDGGGLRVFNPGTRLFRPVPLQSKRKGADNRLAVLALKMSRRKGLLIGTYPEGLFVLDPASGQYRQLLQGTADGDLNANDIYCIKERP